MIIIMKSFPNFKDFSLAKGVGEMREVSKTFLCPWWFFFSVQVKKKKKGKKQKNFWIMKLQFQFKYGIWNRKLAYC